MPRLFWERQQVVWYLLLLFLIHSALFLILWNPQCWSKSLGQISAKFGDEQFKHPSSCFSILPQTHLKPPSQKPMTRGTRKVSVGVAPKLWAFPTMMSNTRQMPSRKILQGAQQGSRDAPEGGSPAESTITPRGAGRGRGQAGSCSNLPQILLQTATSFNRSILKGQTASTNPHTVLRLIRLFTERAVTG